MNGTEPARRRLLRGTMGPPLRGPGRIGGRRSLPRPGPRRGVGSPGPGSPHGGVRGPLGEGAFHPRALEREARIVQEMGKVPYPPGRSGRVAVSPSPQRAKAGRPAHSPLRLPPGLIGDGVHAPVPGAHRLDLLHAGRGRSVAGHRSQALTPCGSSPWDGPGTLGSPGPATRPSRQRAGYPRLHRRPGDPWGPGPGGAPS